MKTCLSIALLASVLGACGSKKHDGVACDSVAVDALRAKLDNANGIGLYLADPKVKADMAAATKELTGTVFALTGCKFHMQGNDKVWFVASDATEKASDRPSECQMKGGVDGVTKFRDAMMQHDRDKLRLDVTGTIASTKDPKWPELALTSCEIDAYE